jgi:branched-chain amino acid transport system ATP-binding protein
MAKAPILTLEKLSAGYGDEPIVREVDLSVAPGSITTIIGANGAGKSTLMRGMYGTIRHFGGSIALDGEPIHTLEPVGRLSRGLSFVPQGRCNFQKMSVRENLELGTYTLTKGRMKPAIERVVTLFPMLKTKWSSLAGNMSGGEQQVLEMGIALLLEPKVIMLDEPSLGLSPKMLAQVFRTVLDIRDTGVTVVMVEQNARAALLISDSAVVMEMGRKSFEGAARAVLDDPRIKAAYLGG